MNLDWGQILAEADARPDALPVAAALHLLHSPRALKLVRWIAPRDSRVPPHYRPSAAFTLDLVRRLYAEYPERVVWASVFTPCELFWGLGLTPFYPEVAAAAGAALGLTPRALAQASEAGLPVDLCTYHRAALGLTRDGFFPPAAAFVATSSLCSLAGITLAAEAHRRRKPFRLIDVPPTFDSDSLDYVEAQLETLVAELETATGIRYDPDRMGEAIRLSNQTRALALEFNALRANRPAPIRGGPMLGVVGLAVWVLGLPDGVSHFRAWRDYTAGRVRRRDPEQPLQKIRLFWLHLRPYAESGLIAHLEDDLGAVIAFEEHNTIWWEALDESRPLRALAAKILAHPSNGSAERRLAMILDGVARYECDGVVHFSHWGCRQASGAVRVIRDRLRREGIPMLELDGDCIDPTNLQIGPLRTRIEAFVETLV